LVVPHYPDLVGEEPGRWSTTVFDASWPARLTQDPDLACVLWGFGTWPRAPLVAVLAGRHLDPPARLRAQQAIRTARQVGAALVLDATSPHAGEADLVVATCDPALAGPGRTALRSVLRRGGAVIWLGGPRSRSTGTSRDRATAAAVALSEVTVAAAVAPHPDGGGLATATALRLGRPVVCLEPFGAAPLQAALHRSLIGDAVWAHNVLATPASGEHPTGGAGPEGDDLVRVLTAALSG
jgi:hypothetical protein